MGNCRVAKKSGLRILRSKQPIKVQSEGGRDRQVEGAEKKDCSTNFYINLLWWKKGEREKGGEPA